MRNIGDNAGAYYDQHRNKIFGIVIIVATVVFLGWYWWNKVYESPTNVFWGMVDNSLETKSLYKTFDATSQGVHLSQAIQLQLGARNLVYSKVTYTQTAGVVKVEELNTSTDDYIRYDTINTNQKSSNGKPRDFKAILGYWGRQTLPQNSSSNLNIYYKTLTGFIAFGDLTSSQRAQLVNFLKTKNVYQFKNSDVQRVNENGRLIYKYKMGLSEEGYLEYVRNYSKIMGLPTLDSVNLSSFNGAPLVSFSISIDPSSRQLTELDSSDGSSVEKYTGYNIKQPAIPSLPTTTLPLAELQQDLSNLASD